MQWRTRIAAMAVHFLVSLCVAAAGAALVFACWYPGAYSELAGGSQLFWLLTSVDIVIGPVLTFAVFDKSKGISLLRRDLIIIASLQAAAFFYGIHTAYAARPVALVYEVDRFRVVAANEILGSDLVAAPEQFRKLPFSSVWLLGTRRSKPGEVLGSVDLAVQGYDISQRPTFWVHYDVVRSSVLANGRPISVMSAHCPPRFLAWLSQQRFKEDANVLAVPLTARKVGWAALVDKQGDLLGFGPCDAFEISRPKTPS